MGFLLLISTNKPEKKFPIECQLLLKYGGKSRFLRKFFRRRIVYKYGCYISHTAKIDESVKFIHPVGLVIGADAIIEEHCTILHHVTIGTHFNCDDERMPRVKRNTMIGAGAKIIGDIVIGENCIVGANAVVTKSVPDNSVVTGANIVRKRDMD